MDVSRTTKQSIVLVVGIKCLLDCIEIRAHNNGYAYAMGSFNGGITSRCTWWVQTL